MFQMFAEKYCTADAGGAPSPAAFMLSTLNSEALGTSDGAPSCRILAFRIRTTGCSTQRSVPRPLPYQPTLPVWSFLSSIVLLYIQPTLLHALAQRLTWPTATKPAFAIHFSGYSAGSTTRLHSTHWHCSSRTALLAITTWSPKSALSASSMSGKTSSASSSLKDFIQGIWRGFSGPGYVASIFTKAEEVSGRCPCVL